MRSTMLKTLALLVVLAFCASVASAGCGTKDTHQGTLTAADADNNTVVVEVDGKEVELALTSKTEVMDADGNEVELANLVGKQVKIVSEHAKIDSIQQLA